MYKPLVSPVGLLLSQEKAGVHRHSWFFLPEQKWLLWEKNNLAAAPVKWFQGDQTSAQVPIHKAVLQNRSKPCSLFSLGSNDTASNPSYAGSKISPLECFRLEQLNTKPLRQSAMLPAFSATANCSLLCPLPTAPIVDQANPAVPAWASALDDLRPPDRPVSAPQTHHCSAQTSIQGSPSNYFYWEKQT